MLDSNVEVSFDLNETNERSELLAKRPQKRHERQVTLEAQINCDFARVTINREE